MYGARTATWVKVKNEASDEFVVVGYAPPRGSRTAFGSILMARPEHGILRYAGRVGTGFDEATLRDIFKRLSTGAIHGRRRSGEAGPDGVRPGPG